jgi:hypothetical protein
MDYQKYLKYKTKYLQLKAKFLTQLGGAPRWNVEDTSKKGITQSESNYIQQQYEIKNSNEFTIPSTHSAQRYRYRLNIGKGTGVRINNKDEETIIILTDNTSAMPSSAMSQSPGGRVTERRFSDARSMTEEPPSKPKLSLSLQQAKNIIKKYVEKIKKKNYVSNTELAEIIAAKNIIDEEETEQQKKTAVMYLYEYAEQFNKSNFTIVDERFFQQIITDLSTY